MISAASQRKTASFPVGKGRRVVLDAADFERVRGFAWFLQESRGAFYVWRADAERPAKNGSPGRRWLAHHILGLPHRARVIFANGNKLDCRRGNLRRARTVKTMPALKICAHCGKVLPGGCAPCQNARRRAWNETHRERRNELARERLRREPEKKEKSKARNYRWRRANREKYLEGKRAESLRRREKLRAERAGSNPAATRNISGQI